MVFIYVISYSHELYLEELMEINRKYSLKTCHKMFSSALLNTHTSAYDNDNR